MRITRSYAQRIFPRSLLLRKEGNTMATSKPFLPPDKVTLSKTCLDSAKNFTLSIPVISTLLGSSALAAAAVATSFAAKILLPFSTPVLLGVFAAPAILTNVFLIRSLFKSYKAAKNNVEPKTTKADIVFSHLHSGTSIIFSSAYLTYRTLTTFLAGKALFYSSLSLTHAVPLLGIGAAALLLGIGIYKYVKAKKLGPSLNNPQAPKKWKSLLGTVVFSLAIGALVGTAGWIGLNFVLISLLLLAEMHAYLHGLRFNLGQLVVLKKHWKLITDQEVSKLQSLLLHNLTKTTGRGSDLLACVFPTILIRKGSAYQHILVHGGNPYKDPEKLKKTQEAIQFMSSIFEDLYQEVSASHQSAQRSQDLEEAYQQLGQIYRCLADRYTDEKNGLWRGDFGAVDQKLGDGFYAESENALFRRLGELIKAEGEKLRQRGKWFESRKNHLCTEEVEREYQILLRRFALFREKNLILFCRSQYRNLNPRARSKIEELSRLYARAGLTMVEVLRKDRRTGEYYKELIPLRYARRRDKNGNYIWVDLIERLSPSHPEYVESHSKEIAYIDYSTDRGPRATYKPGCHSSSADPVVWIGGEKNSRLEVAETWKDFPPQVLCFDKVPYTIQTDGGVVDIDLLELAIALDKDAKQSYLKCRYKVPIKAALPFSPDLRERKEDLIVRTNIVRTPYLLYFRKKGETKWRCVPWKPATEKAISNPQEVAAIKAVRKPSFTPGILGPCYIEVIYKNGKQKLVQVENSENYPSHLPPPEQIEALQIDVGVTPAGSVKMGSLHAIRYVLQRRDGTTYEQFLPLHSEPPPFDPETVDYDLLNRQAKKERGFLLLRGNTWTGRRYPFYPQKMLLDPGTYDHPALELRAVATPERFFREHKLPESKYVLGLSVNGQIQWHSLPKLRLPKRKIIEHRVGGPKRIDLTFLKEQRIIEWDSPQPDFLEWVDKTAVVEENGRQHLLLHFQNPFNHNDHWEEKILLSDKVLRELPDLAQIYNGGQHEYQPQLFSMSITKDRKPRFYLRVSRVKTQSLTLDFKIPSQAKVSVVKVKSAVAFEDKNGTTHWLPFEEDIRPDKVFLDPQSRWNSKLTFGRFDAICSSKNFTSPSIKHIPGRFGRTDQAVFFSKHPDTRYASTEDTFWSKHRISGIGGPIQPDKEGLKEGEEAVLLPGTSFAQSRINPLTFSEYEPELPWPVEVELELWKSIVEDAQRSFEALVMDGAVTGYSALHHSIEEDGAEQMVKLLTQRRRWLTGLGYGILRGFGFIYRDLIYGRLLRKFPPALSLHQIYHWVNVFTWYYDALAKYILVGMPFFYQISSASPILIGEGLSFPVLWTGQYLSNTTSYLYNMHKAGVNPFYAFSTQQGIYYLICPILAEGCFRSVDEATGEFKPTKEAKGGIPPQYLRQTWLYFFGLSALSAGIGIYRALSYHGFAPGLFVNTIWPLWNAFLSSLGLRAYYLSQGKKN